MQYIHDNYVTRGVFSDDVVLKCNAVGVADESRFFSITDYPRNNYSEWTSFLSAALDLTKSVRLTVGGETKFVCVDGPDFDGHQVDWDNMMMRMKSFKPQETEAFHKCKIGLSK